MITHTEPDNEHAVLVFLAPIDVGEFGLDEIEDPIIDAINSAGVGEFDGNVIGPDGATLYSYGSDADAIYEAIAPVLATFSLPQGSYVVKRYGPPGARETRIELR